MYSRVISTLAIFIALGGTTYAVQRGPAGPRGPRGPRGHEGIQGKLGEQGLMGLSGPAGPTGPPGRDGTQQGPPGKEGYRGATGPEGKQGPGQPTFLGEFKMHVKYFPEEQVRSQGCIWVDLFPSENEPPPQGWEKYLCDGTTGPTGPTGAT